MLCLDGTKCRTIKTFIKYGFPANRIAVFNYNKEIINLAKYLGVESAYQESLESGVSDEIGLDLEGSKIAIIIDDGCGTPFGGKMTSDPDFRYKQYLKHYVGLGTIITMTVCERINFAYKGSATHTEFRRLYIIYLHKVAKNYGWIIKTSNEQEYGKNMFHVVIEIVAKLHIEKNSVKKMDALYNQDRNQQYNNILDILD